MILVNRLPGKNLVFQLWPKIFPANQIAEEKIDLFKGTNQSFRVFALK